MSSAVSAHPLGRAAKGLRADSLDMHVEIYPGVPAVAEIGGEIDMASAPWLRETLLLAIRRHGPVICVDLQGVTFLDCSGVNVLLATARRAWLEGGRMQLVRPSPQAWRVITLLGLRDVLTRDGERDGNDIRLQLSRPVHPSSSRCIGLAAALIAMALDEFVKCLVESLAVA